MRRAEGGQTDDAGSASSSPSSSQAEASFTEKAPRGEQFCVINPWVEGWRPGPLVSIQRRVSLRARAETISSSPPLFSPILPAKAGTQVIVPYRDPYWARELRVMGDLGQIVPMVRLVLPLFPSSSLSRLPQRSTLQADDHSRFSTFSTRAGMGTQEPTSDRGMSATFGRRLQLLWSRVRDKVSLTLFDLLSPRVECHLAQLTRPLSFQSFPFPRNYTFDEVHNVGAARIAEIAQKNGVSRLIHVSHLNADPNSTSKYYAVSLLACSELIFKPSISRRASTDAVVSFVSETVERTRRQSRPRGVPERDDRSTWTDLRIRG